MPMHVVHLGPWDVRTWTLLGHLPFVALIVLLYLAGRRRGWPWRSSLLATAALVGGLSLGTAILPSVVGAVAGGIAAWILAQRLLGLRRAPWAALALGLATVLAVGRWGCLLNDCCFGRTTELPWAIHYGQGSATWILHRALGWIAPDAPAALGVHPYPLYESVGLLLWLPVALWLSRRLRSEGALLLFTAAYDLALRGFIDGTRAMVNVWWTLLGSRWGLGLFQWALLGGALACLAAGLALERQARATAPGPVDEVRAPTPEASWAIFLGLCAIGWASSAEQTLFLHRALVGALVASALALRLPAWLPLFRRIHAWAAPALAAALALPVVLHVEHLAEAGDPASHPSAGRRGWLYDVDHQRGVLVRVGTQQESPESVAQRREALALPDSALPAPPPAPPRTRVGRTWVGAGALGGKANYRVGESCGGDYTLYDRRAGGGWVQAEHELPATPTSVWWLGGRVSALVEAQKKTVHDGDSSTDTVGDYGMQSYGAQAWAEWEHPNLAVGVGAMGVLRSREVEGQGASWGSVLRPSLRLRAGASFLAIDGSYCDRQSLLGPTGGQIGLSGAIGRGFTRIAHPDDTAVRYFVGGVVFPGADDQQSRFMLGAGLEIFATPRLVLGFRGAGGDGMFGLGYVRAVVAP